MLAQNTKVMSGGSGGSSASHGLLVLQLLQLLQLLLLLLVVAKGVVVAVAVLVAMVVFAGAVCRFVVELMRSRSYRSKCSRGFYNTW